MINLPPDASPIPLADWVELVLLFDDTRGFMSQSDMLDLLGVLPDFDEPDEAFGRIDWVAVQESEEANLREELRLQEKIGVSPLQLRVDDVWTEFRRRSLVIGANYPFDVTPTRVDLTRHSNIYRFLSLLGARLLFEIGEDDVATAKPARYFEHLVALALARLVGGSGKRFGWPHRADELPRDFRDAVTELCRTMNEDIGKHKTVSPDAKDHWLDVIAWRGFSDLQPSQTVVLCQCAIGKNWHEKHIDIERWHSDVIEFVNRPQNALAFVVHLASQRSDVARGAAAVGGVLLDRSRIASLVSDGELPDDLSKAVIEWNAETATSLPRSAEGTNPRPTVSKKAAKKVARKTGSKTVRKAGGRLPTHASRR